MQGIIQRYKLKTYMDGTKRYIKITNKVHNGKKRVQFKNETLTSAFSSLLKPQTRRLTPFRTQ